MLKVGITGQSGFIGTHLFNFLNLKKDDIITIPFNNSYFENSNQLNSFVTNCDVIVHLAAMNRHLDQKVIYDTNIGLVDKLITALTETGSTTHVLFSSSIHKHDLTGYGISKDKGSQLFKKWASHSKGRFTELVIPNVFGSFGKPFYNSVIATFCYQLTHNEQPLIDADTKLPLIYIDRLVDLIYQKIIKPECQIDIYQTQEIMVSEILLILEDFKNIYFDDHCFPSLSSMFRENLFNTFRGYIDYSNYYPISLKKNIDSRGTFTEITRTLDGGQFSLSTTMPGITRGNHYHTRKIERFIVIQGRAVIELRRIGTSDKLSFELDGNNPSFVDTPIWFTHNITNIGDEELITLLWVNEFFDQDDPDTYSEKV